MQNTILSRTEPTIDRDALILASLILKEVHQMIKGIHILIAVLLRYTTVSVSITNSLIDQIMPAPMGE